MKKGDIRYIIGIILISVFWTLPVFCQGPKAEPAEKPKAEKETEELSIYGEVQTVNSTAGSLLLQYYDYDNDEEKTIEIVVDKSTKIENAAKLDEIKQGDWVDATYSVVEGKNIAQSIVVEKEEPEEALPMEKAAGDIPVVGPDE